MLTLESFPPGDLVFEISRAFKAITAMSALVLLLKLALTISRAGAMALRSGRTVEFTLEFTNLYTRSLVRWTLKIRLRVIFVGCLVAVDNITNNLSFFENRISNVLHVLSLGSSC